jgi:hypothetical protein
VQQPVAAVQWELSLQTAAATATHQAAAPQAPEVAQQAVTVADSLAQFQKVFCQFPWTGSLLQYFFEREKENLLRNAGNNRQQTQETLEMIHQHINVLWKSIQRDQRTIGEQVQREVFDLVQSVMEDSLEIYDATGNKLTKVTDVLKYSFKHLMDQVEGKPDAEKPRNLSIRRRFIQAQLNQQQSVDEMEEVLKNFEKYGWSITHLLPESSFGIFFRMPGWVAELVLFVIEHNVMVKDQLIDQGYRALWPLKRSALLHSNTPSTDFKIAFEGVAFWDDIPEEYFSLVCGYNIRECPLWVPRPDGISFSGHEISQEHRNLLKTLADDYRKHVVLLPEEEGEEEEEEEEGEEEGGKEAMQASERGVPTEGAVSDDDALEEHGVQEYLSVIESPAMDSKKTEGANQETAAPHSSVAPPASTVPHPRILSAAAGDLQVGAAGSSGGQGASKQIRTHVFSATEIGAAIAAASEAVSSGPEREFDGLVKLLSSCRSLMAVEPVVHFKP